MNKPTEKDLEILRPLTTRQSVSFPNGSAYEKEIFPVGANSEEEFMTPRGIVKIRCTYNFGYKILMPDKRKVFVSFREKPVGAGADFGAYYNSRDLVLADLYPAAS